jgi:hypothetical protein
MQKYRFCNVFRELDRTTIWLRENIRQRLPPNDVHAHLRAVVIFRYLNRIETGEALSDLLHWPSWRDDTLDVVEKRLRRLVAEGRPILGAAYMIKTPLRRDKVSGLLEIWRALLGQQDTLINSMLEGNSLQHATELLSEQHYVGPFMAYEIVTDLRHTSLLGSAHDIMTWANPGPGAMRGGARMLNLAASDLSRSNRSHVTRVMDTMKSLLWTSKDPFFWPAEWGAWEMRDVEHNLCEFDKYERARLGEGAPKQLYRERT